MAKQRGGSPFTDSWFEMPFWFLFFLLIITVILLWQFGIFNKPVAIAQPVQTKFANTNTNLTQPELTIEEVIPQSDAMSVKVTYSTKYTVDGQIVCIRMYETDEYIPTGATAFKFFPVGKNTVTVQNTNPAPNKHFLLESYIKAADDVSLSPLVITPFQFKSTQPGARNSSASSDPLPSASSGPGKKAYTSPSLVGTH